MIASLRERFNRSFTPALYQSLLAEVDRKAGCHVKYRQAETPCFFPKRILHEMSEAGEALVTELLANPQYLADSRAIIPPEYDTPYEAPHPMFVCADFGLVCTETGRLEPRLVEIQGFPSLYASQRILSQQYIDTYKLEGVGHYLGGHTESSYHQLLSRAILNGHDPENVVLLEIDPENQKTLPDFKATQRFIGIPYICVTKVRKQGNRLFYEHEGRHIPILRIYNRVIADELARLNIETPFRFCDDLNVEWAGHPNWFFRLSKFSIPYLRHYTVPQTMFLSDVPELPADLENYVLKPLFSFAGLGVIVGPTRQQVDAITHERRRDYILQQRMDFEPVVETPHGATKAEVRVMYIWLDKMIPVLTIIRMGRGKMMGVDHNKNMEWVGGSAGLYPLDGAA
ncbi:MAG: hypothetical protein HY820_04955 [Acidobacteria bacterium]|nr:hypothetical protein [Acidobacteriota bacterium]